MKHILCWFCYSHLGYKDLSSYICSKCLWAWYLKYGLSNQLTKSSVLVFIHLLNIYKPYLFNKFANDCVVEVINVYPFYALLERISNDRNDWFNFHFTFYTDFVNYANTWTWKFIWKVTTHDMQTSQYGHLLVPAVWPALFSCRAFCV